MESIERQRSTNVVVVGWEGVGWRGVESIERQRSTNVVVVVGWEGEGWSGKHWKAEKH